MQIHVSISYGSIIIIIYIMGVVLFIFCIILFISVRSRALNIVILSVFLHFYPHPFNAYSNKYWAFGKYIHFYGHMIVI